MATLCLDNSFVVDYTNGEEYTREFLVEHIGRSEVYIPHIVVYEALVPAFLDDVDVAPEFIKSQLDGFKQISFNDDHAEEAAKIRAKLRSEGRKIGSPDVLIAGLARALNAKVVTRDAHFERVPDLDVVNPRDAY